MNLYPVLTFSSTILLVLATVFSADEASIFSWSTKNELWNELLQLIPINGGAAGPECFTFDREGGGPYTGVSDGRILKWVDNESKWIDFAVTTPNRKGCEGSYDHSWTEQRCGRPLGLSFNPRTGDLYIADAYMGLMKVSPSGGVAVPLVTEVQGVPMAFTNALDIDPRTGVIYFTDSSTKYPRKNFLSLIITGDNTGRLMKFDPPTNKVTVLLNKLMFPNGVSLSKNGEFLIVAETTNSRVLKYWLEPSKAGKVEVFAQLPGFPDNIHRNHKGEFWVAINPNGQKFSKSSSKIPVDHRTRRSSYFGDDSGTGWAVKLSEEGKILEILGGKSETTLISVSEVCEMNGVLWIGSVEMPFMAKLNVSETET